MILQFSIFNYQLSIILSTFAPAFKKSKHWRDGRVVDYCSLENYRTERYRGFESLSLRNIKGTDITDVSPFSIIPFSLKKVRIPCNSWS